MSQPFHRGPLCTLSTLTQSLHSLGLRPGTTLLLHSSLSSLGFVIGGAETLIQALLSILGPEGTLIVPAFTPWNSDPEGWSAPPVPREWWAAIREGTPGFDARIAPADRAMGCVPEMLRGWPGAVRSAHPQTSFVALGAGAERFMRGHEWDCRLGRRSPLGRLEEEEGKGGEGRVRVLLLGVGWDKCTAFHLAEDTGAEEALVENSFAVMNPDRMWITVRDVEYDGEGFAEMGEAFEREEGEGIRRGRVGGADARLFGFGRATAFARRWLPLQRGGG